ncbi:MAG TPA: helix-turn-helix transcriptional regulator [Blastocatellia bacterium]|nr:helix-turn-helix transcriptional regulator [Blastocatellia bacterium]
MAEPGVNTKNLYQSRSFGNVSPAMIKLLVKEVAQRAGINNPNELAEATGLHYESCRIMWRGNPKMMGLGTLEVLCRTLSVLPGQLFELEPRLGESITPVEDAKRKQKKKVEGGE